MVRLSGLLLKGLLLTSTVVLVLLLRARDLLGDIDDAHRAGEAQRFNMGHLAAEFAIPRAKAAANGEPRPSKELVDTYRTRLPALVPKPQELVCDGAKPALVLTTVVRLAFGDDVSLALESVFRDVWRRVMGFDLLVGSSDLMPGEILLMLSADDTLPKEGYSVSFVDREGGAVALDVEVSHHEKRAAVVHALETLRQLLRPQSYSAGVPQLPAPMWRCYVRDWPRHHWRGLMLDVARHFFDVGEIKRLLRIMSMHKLNVLHLHLTDDQGWRVEVPGMPELTDVGARRGPSINDPHAEELGSKRYSGRPYSSPRFLSVADVRELVAFAGSLAIDIVPEVDMPAHTAAAILAARSVGKDIGVVELHEGCAEMQGFQPLQYPPNCMGGTHGIVVPTMDALEYIATAVSKVADLFPSRYFHIGGDEAEWFRDVVYTSKLGLELMRGLGLDSPSQLQGYIATQLFELLRAKGKTVIAWDETALGLEGYIAPKDLVIMWWRDWAEEASWRELKASGRKAILTPVSKVYLDFYQMDPHSDSRFPVQEGTSSLRAVYSTVWYSGDFVEGVQGNLWSETLVSEEVLHYQLLPRAAAIAEVGWTERSRATDFWDFLARLQHHRARLERMGLTFYNGSYVGNLPEDLSLEMSLAPDDPVHFNL